MWFFTLHYSITSVIGAEYMCWENVIITKFHSFSPFFVKKSVHKISICTREKKNGPELTFIFPAVQMKFVLLLHTCNQASLFLENFVGKRLFIETGDCSSKSSKFSRMSCLTAVTHFNQTHLSHELFLPL